MFFQETIIEEVRESNDIIAIISQYITLQKRGGNHVGLCPFHNERTPSFSVSPSKQLYHCFGCGVGGNVFTFIMEYENYTFAESLKFLAERANIALPEKEYSEAARRQASVRDRLLEINKEAAKYFYVQLKSARGDQGREYLANRGFSEETILKFGLGYSNKASNDLYNYLKSLDYHDQFLSTTGLVTIEEKSGGRDKFWNRIMFPIMDVNSRVIGFGGRVMGDGMPKYINSPETTIFDKSRNLYGLNIARRTRADHIMVCEGYIDVMALYQAGFDNAVASLGTAFTGPQAKLLGRYTKEVILVYDNDNAGIKAGLRAINTLKEENIVVKVVDLAPYNDPDDFIKGLGKDEFQIRIDQAKSSFFFEMDVLQSDYNMKDPSEKTNFVHAIAKKLLEIEEELERNIYIDAVAKNYEIDGLKLGKLVNKMGADIVIGIREIKSTKTGVKNKNKAKDVISQSQRMILTWLIEDNNLFEKIHGIITVNDFTDDIYGEVAKLVFKQYNEEGEVMPAKIINHFESKDEQSTVAALFSAKLMGEIEGQALEKALNDTIKKLKEFSLDIKSRKAIEDNDSELFQETIEERAYLKNIYIKLVE